MEGNKQGGPQPHEEAVAQLSAESRALEVQEATGTSMHQPDLWEAYMTAQILALWGKLLWSWSSSQEQPIQLAKATNKLPNSRKRKVTS